MILNRSSKSRHSCSRFNLRGQHLVFSPRRIILAVEFFVDTLYQDVDISFFSYFAYILKTINGLILSSACSMSIEMIE